MVVLKWLKGSVRLERVMVYVLKFQKTSCLQKKSHRQTGKPQIRRSSLIRVFPVFYSDKHFVTSSPDIEPIFLFCKV